MFRDAGIEYYLPMHMKECEFHHGSSDYAGCFLQHVPNQFHAVHTVGVWVLRDDSK